jgi:hypothetical protein
LACFIFVGEDCFAQGFMSVQDISGDSSLPDADSKSMADAGHSLPVLVGKVYEKATPLERGRLLEHLLKPLGVLALVAIANGIFARLTLVNGWSRLTIRPEDTQFIDPQDVVTLASRVQQVSVQAIEGLSQIVGASPVLAGSTAAAMLLAILAKQRMSQMQMHGNDFDVLP